MNSIEQIWKILRLHGFHNEVFPILERVIDRLYNMICSRFQDCHVYYCTALDLVLLLLNTSFKAEIYENRCLRPRRQPASLCEELHHYPHISWVPKESRQRIMDCAVANAKAYIAGVPTNVVNK